jgi:iron-sulfur cluster repair protein YtfE (RIC family)
MEQTAIQWLLKELKYYREFETFYNNENEKIETLIKTALRIEQMHNRDSWLNGYNDAINDVNDEMQADNIDDINTPNFGILK